MTTLTGTLITERGMRYVMQICDHLDQLLTRRETHGGPPVLGIDRLPDGAVIEFAWGTCELEAAEASLTVTITADEAAMQGAKQMITQRLEAFAHREGAAVLWE